MNENKADLKRRAFLLTLGAGGAGVAAGAAVAGKEASAPTDKPLAAPELRRDAGISEHMRNYYRSARI